MRELTPAAVVALSETARRRKTSVVSHELATLTAALCEMLEYATPIDAMTTMFEIVDAVASVMRERGFVDKKGDDSDEISDTATDRQTR